MEISLKNSGSTFQWLENGVLKTVTKVLPAIRIDSGIKRSNTKNFFNSVVAAYTGRESRESLFKQMIIIVVREGHYYFS